MISESQLIDRLVADEDEVLHAYECPAGYLTIGVGRLIDQRRGGGITQEESRYLLRNDIRRIVSQCESRFDWWDLLDHVRQQAIVCMAFQLGVNGVANFRKMVAAIKVRDFAEAARQMIDSGWHKQTKARCERMAEIMRTGEWK